MVKNHTSINFNGIIGISIYKVIDVNKFQNKEQFQEQQGEQTFQNRNICNWFKC